MKLLATALLSVCALSAAPITGLYNTGASTTGGVDNYWRIVAPPERATVILQSNYPATWVSPSSTSAWVWNDNAGQPTGTGASPLTYVFRYTFTLASNLDPSTVNITGEWATDNYGSDILVNGMSTGQSSGGYTSFTRFTLGANFWAGVNTIDFVVTDWGNIGGFRAQWDTANAELLAPVPAPVPEPSTWALAAIGAAGILFSKFRR